ncbi:TrbI F-type domain-containing protein [Sphingomonas paucimobilis]|uniref:TrbI F-type domain-containing protein n=1 Tax=Sphingomonas paucimobilis TaxID=13689 RepID=A0A7Y2KS30_SPHPI|nr:TrbI F-type domain-containing protein [Sphingomonas paucimobilis]NNG58575.1 TrbI F-type domain-containing protein [Sphingomonas paucimobilis]
MVDVLDTPAPAAAVHPTDPASDRFDFAGAELPSSRRPSGATPPSVKKAEGLPPITWAMAAIAIVMLLWGAWVTKHIASPTAAVPMASVRLETIVSEYVQAQSHSNGQPEAVAAQTRAFMGALDQELQKIGASGTTVLVGEAILSKNVPDITDQIRRAVYAKVPLPAAAPASPAGPAVGAVAPSASGAAAPIAPAASPFAPPAQGSALDAAIAPSVTGSTSGQ